MRGKRSKQYRKLMQQYGLIFGFREPYQVLIDAQMLQDTARFKMDLVAGLERTLHGQVKPMITQCTIRHLYNLPTNSSTTSPFPNIPIPAITTAAKNALIDLAKTFERRRCNHHTLEEPLSTLACFTSVIDPKGSGTNKNRYVVASQEEEVRRWARGVRGVPSVYVKRSVMVMEPMSEGSVGVREGQEKGKLRGGVRKIGDGRGQGTKRKREGEEGGARGTDEGPDGTAVKKTRKAKGPKGPNPLSVKKAKTKHDDLKGVEPAGDKDDGGSGEQMVMAMIAGRESETFQSGRHTADGIDALDEGSALDLELKKRRKRKHKSKPHDEVENGTVTAMGEGENTN